MLRIVKVIKKWNKKISLDKSVTFEYYTNYVVFKNYKSFVAVEVQSHCSMGKYY